MKNIIIIFFVVLLFFGLTFCAYWISFHAYFNGGKLSKGTKRITRMLFQRDSDAALVSLSPLGMFSMRNYSVAERGGFKHGTLVSINSVTAKLSIIKILRRDFYIENINAKGINVNLDFGKKNKAGYVDLFANLQYLFVNKSLKYGMVRKLEVNSVSVDESSINLKFDSAEINFKDITLKSGGFSNEDNFKGNVSFSYEIMSDGENIFSGNGSLSFEYDNAVKTVYIKDFLSPDISLSADGEVKFSQDGSLKLSYVAKINKRKLRDIFFPGLPAGGSVKSERKDIDDDIIISYPFSDSLSKDKKMLDLLL
ncbi:MAG: hypothetical protein LBR69_00845 [Endomicrobium sp.]|jgi:hypothetical protein|nr:hypothetical protein [Endomicrobium sp.]